MDHSLIVILLCLFVGLTTAFRMEQTVLTRFQPMIKRNYYQHTSRLIPLTAKLDNSIPLSQYSKLGKQITDVIIEAPSLNTRRITASAIIDSSMENVWSILTDYNNLATHVPNLVKSTLVPGPPGSIRLFQEGAQKIIGFDFRASLVMDMTEERDLQQTEASFNTAPWKVGFKLIESRMFDSFDGSWQLRYHSRVAETNPVTKEVTYKYKTKLTYSVFVRPRGPVPVMALEWRIREDIPINLYAVKIAAEKRSNAISSQKVSEINTNVVNSRPAPAVTTKNNTVKRRVTTKPVILGMTNDDWHQDETLQSYMDPDAAEDEEDDSSPKYPKKVRVYEVQSPSSSSSSGGIMAAVNTFFGFNSSFLGTSQSNMNLRSG